MQPLFWGSFLGSHAETFAHQGGEGYVGAEGRTLHSSQNQEVTTHEGHGPWNRGFAANHGGSTQTDDTYPLTDRREIGIMFVSDPNYENHRTDLA
jgi:hypothetical protein